MLTPDSDVADWTISMVDGLAHMLKPKIALWRSDLASKIDRCVNASLSINPEAAVIVFRQSQYYQLK